MKTLESKNFPYIACSICGVEKQGLLTMHQSHNHKKAEAVHNLNDGEYGLCGCLAPKVLYKHGKIYVAEWKPHESMAEL